MKPMLNHLNMWSSRLSKLALKVLPLGIGIGRLHTFSVEYYTLCPCINTGRLDK